MLVRTQISLTKGQKRKLDQQAARQGVSVSELVRRAIDSAYADDYDVAATLADLRAAAGAWKDRDFTGEEFVERMRSGRRLREAFERPGR